MVTGPDGICYTATLTFLFLRTVCKCQYTRAHGKLLPAFDSRRMLSFFKTSRNDGYIALPTGADPHDAADDHGQHELNTNESTTKLTSGAAFTLAPDGHSYTYAYGPPGLAGLSSNYYTLLCAFFASIGGLTFGYDQGVIANVLVMKDFIQRWPVTPLQKGIMTAVLELGALIGALAAGILADRHSRRYAILAASLVFCLGSAFQTWAQSLSHLFIGRAVGGVGVGALSMLSPLYMAEISPPEVRGSLMALEQFSIVLGVVLGFWTGFWTREIPSSLSWRLPLGIQLIPGLFLGFGCLFLPPSPRYLVLHGRYEEALSSLRRLRSGGHANGALGGGGGVDDALLQVELLEMRVETTLVQRSLEIEDEGEEVWSLRTELRAWRRLLDEKYRDRTMIGVLIMVFQQWSGINALLYYGPTIVQSVGLKGDTVTLIVSGGIGIVQFLAVVPVILYIDAWGRKPLLRGGSVLMTCSHLLIAFLVWRYQSSWAEHSWAAWGSIAGIYTFTAAYGVSFGPVGWVLPSEVFPLSMRSKGVALSTASNWVNNFLIGLLTPALMDASPSLTFTIFAVACTLAYFWSTIHVPETANVSLEDIDKLFKSEAGARDKELRKQIEEEVGLTRLVRSLVGERADES